MPAKASQLPKQYWPLLTLAAIAVLVLAVVVRRELSSWKWLVGSLIFGLIAFTAVFIRQARTHHTTKEASETDHKELPPADVADVLIEYSHDDRVGSVVYSDSRGPIQRANATPPRDRPLVLKNITPGKNALNVRVRPVEAHSDKLVFRPDIITSIVGSGSAEVVPVYEGTPLPKSGVSRFRKNHLPDFLNGLYDRNERNDKESLDELFRENSLWLEIEYESEGKRIISECELLYTRWHEQIRTGQHRVRLADQASAKQIKIPKEVWQQQLRDSHAAVLNQRSAAMNGGISREDWLQLKKDFLECPRDIRAEYFRSGKPPEDKWWIGGMPHPDKCRALCRLAGSMLLRSPTVGLGLSEEIRSVADPMDRWLYFLKERKALGNFLVAYEEIDGQKVGSYSGIINRLPEVSADACIDCAAKET